MKKGVIHILFLFYFGVNAQELKTISGTIYNQADSSKLGFVNISIQGSAVGTFSDKFGCFILHIPDSLIARRLIISSIGFYNYEEEITRMDVNNKILLKPHSYSLDPIIILPDSMDAKDIVKKAFRKISKNYPKKKYYIEAFYRGLAYDNSKYLRLVEAAIGIFDNGYKSNPLKARIKVLELRKSNDYVKYSKYKNVFEFIFGNENSLYKVYYSNPLRTEKKDFGITLDKDFINTYSFKLQDLTYIDSSVVYKISFNKYLHGGTMNGNRGVLYINLDDFAIIKIVSGKYFETHEGHPVRDYLYNEVYFSYNIVSFRKINGKYYPVFFEHNGVLEDFANKDARFQHFLFVNNIYTKKSNYEKIKKKHAEKKDIVLYEKKFTYNPEFWKHYNFLKFNPLPFRVFNDLEKQKTLETQFKDNSKQ